MSSSKFALFGAVALVAVVSSQSAMAAPVALTAASFLASDTTIGFTGVSDGAAVGAAFSGSGVTFSGSLFGMTNSGDTNFFPANGNGVIASNWIYGGSGLQGLSFSATFGSLQNRVGFYLENWPTQTASVELFNGATSLGILALANTGSLTAEFRGVGESSGFDRMVFSNTASNNGFFAIDDFKFGTSSAVPEPASWAMMIAGLGLVGATMRRRAAKVSFA